MNGHFVTWGIDLRYEVALCLDDAARLDGILQDSKASPDTWAARVASVQGDVPAARAVLTISDEFWAGNAALHRALKLDP
jgi:hypothetical protein